MRQPIRVAIDGPAGTGKSTIARMVAQRIGAAYLDTGAMYRTATLGVLRAGIDPADTAGVIAATTDLKLDIGDNPEVTEVTLDGVDVSADIRSAEVTANVSAVSAIAEVRANMVDLQRTLAAGERSVVLEGRDIGTVVIPDAEVKVYLTATPEVRAQRRTDQDRAAGRDVAYEDVLAAVIERDQKDSSRTESPLRPAADAVIVDTSDLTIDQVLDRLVGLAEQASAERTPQL